MNLKRASIIRLYGQANTEKIFNSALLKIKRSFIVSSISTSEVKRNVRAHAARGKLKGNHVKTIIGLILLVSCASAFALKGFLESESENGTLRYCKYSNGVIITISSPKICPLSVD